MVQEQLYELYGSLQGQSIWCRDNCNEFVLQLTGQSVWCKGNFNEYVWRRTGTEYMVLGQL